MNVVNVPIPLGDVNIEITVRGQPVQTVAQIHLRLLPKPSVVFECEVKDKPFGTRDFDLGEEVVLESLGIRLNIRLLRIVMPNALDDIVKIVFGPNPEPCTVVKQEGQRLQSVTFDVLNFPNFEVDDTVKLEADGWRIEVTAVPDLKRVADALNGQGGFSVTHKGTLVRLNGETFSIEDAENAMDCLRQFLSFARGVYCSPILPVGLNSDGEVVWKQWGSPPVDSWGWTFSWFDTHCSETLAEVFPGFWKCFNYSPHADAARIALAWYLRSNRNNGDSAGGLILSQVALERLADAHGFKKEQNKKGKKNRESAATFIRKLVQKIGIPPELPDGLDTLNEVLCALSSWAHEHGNGSIVCDGPEALVAVRNDLVHPKENLSGISSFKEYEAWNLAQWYVELVLLNMFGSNGEYGNRLIAGRVVGKTKLVPWAAALD